MNIEEKKLKQKKLEKNIENLLISFARETNLKYEGIAIRIHNNEEKQKFSVNVYIENPFK